MGRTPSFWWFSLFFCSLCLLGQPAALQAQEKPAGLAASPAQSLFSPEGLPEVVAEGAEGLAKALLHLKESQSQAGQIHQKAAAEIRELKAKVAALKASLAVGELEVARAEAELKVLAQGQERLRAALKELTKIQEKTAQERQAKAQARTTLQEELGKLEKSQHPVSRSAPLKQAYSRYLGLATEFEREAARLGDLLEKWLKELESGSQDLAASRQQMEAYLERAWWEKLLTRSTYVSLTQQVWAQLTATLRDVLALPGRLGGLVEEAARTGVLAAYLRAKAGPLVGLALVLGFIGLFCRRLGRNLAPRFLAWQSQAEELGLKVILCCGHLLASHLWALGLLAWLAMAVWSLSGWSQPFGQLAVEAAVVMVARHLVRDLLARVFAGPEAGGILPLDEATARFYRRNLRRLASYILLLGVFGLHAARLLAFSSGSQEFLSYIFQVGLLAWAVWVLRTGFFETLVSELPVPPWFQQRGVLRALRRLVLAMLSLILIAGLLGFQALSAYLAQAAAGTGLLVVLAWLLWQVLRGGLKFVLHPHRGRLAGRLPLRQENVQRYYRTLVNGVLALFLLLTFMAGLQLWGIRPAHLARLLEVLTYGPSLGPLKLTPATVGTASLIVYLGFWFSRLIRAFLELNLFPRLDWDRGVCYTISATLHYVVLIIALLTALNVLGFPLANLALVAGALGVGIGFGLQNIVNNFISGLILLFERPIKVGDLLVVDGHWGTVKEIRVRSTIFQTADRAVLIIPNSELLSSKIVNWTHYGWGKVRLTLKVGVAYGSDVRLVTEIIRQVCLANHRVVHDPPPQILFEAFGDNALQFTVWVYLSSPLHRVAATHELNSAILAALSEHGISIPFPQRELFIKNWPAGGPGGLG